MSDEYVKVEPGVWKPATVGETIEGVLINVQKSGRYDSEIYHVECSDGKQIAIFGTTVLSDKMSYVKPGEQFKVVYKGTMKNSKGQDTKLFEVFKKAK